MRGSHEALFTTPISLADKLIEAGHAATEAGLRNHTSALDHLHLRIGVVTTRRRCELVQTLHLVGGQPSGNEILRLHRSDG